MRGDGQLLRQLAVAEDLHVDAGAPDQARFLQRVGRDVTVEQGKEAAKEIDTVFNELLGEVLALRSEKVVSMRKGRERKRANARR